MTRKPPMREMGTMEHMAMMWPENEENIMRRQKMLNTRRLATWVLYFVYEQLHVYTTSTPNFRQQNVVLPDRFQ